MTTTEHAMPRSSSEIDSRTSLLSLSTTPLLQPCPIEYLLPSSNDQTISPLEAGSSSPRLSARAAPFFVPLAVVGGGGKKDEIPPSSRLSRIRSLELPPLERIMSKNSSNDSLPAFQESGDHVLEQLLQSGKREAISVFRKTSTVSEIEEWTLEDGKIALYKIDWHGSTYLSRQRAVSIDSTSTLNSSLSSSTTSSSSSAYTYRTGCSENDSITALAEQDEDGEEDEEFPLSAFESIQRELRENEHVYYREISSSLRVCGRDGEDKNNIVMERQVDLPREQPRYIAKTSFPLPPLPAQEQPHLLLREPTNEGAPYAYPDETQTHLEPGMDYHYQYYQQREIYDAPYPYGQFAVYPPPPPPPAPTPTHPSEYLKMMPYPAYPTISGPAYPQMDMHTHYPIFPPAPYFLLPPPPPPAPPSYFRSQRSKHASLGPSPNNKKGALYKTEMCRSWSENEGQCRYTSRCQFAHGFHELRDPNQKGKNGMGRLRRVSY